jgi:hypothetical protein
MIKEYSKVASKLQLIDNILIIILEVKCNLLQLIDKKLNLYIKFADSASEERIGAALCHGCENKRRIDPAEAEGVGEG